MTWVTLKRASAGGVRGRGAAGARRVGLPDVEGGEAFRGFGLDGYVVDGG